MLSCRAVLHLVHLVELSLEDHKLPSIFRLLIDDSLFELLKGVHYFQEVSVLEEEVKVAQLSLFNDGIDWDQQSVLVEVRLQVAALVLLQLVVCGRLFGNFLNRKRHITLY